MRVRRKVRRQKRLICVDPGIGGTGVAILLQGPPLILTHYEVIRPTVGMSNVAKCSEICDRFSTIIRSHRLDPLYQPVIYIEFPKHLAESGRGYATAASGDLVRLATLTGMLLRDSRLQSIPTIEVPISWKGNLPKAVVKKRVMEAFGLKKIPNHAADAAGIGLWVAGRM